MSTIDAYFRELIRSIVHEELQNAFGVSFPPEPIEQPSADAYIYFVRCDATKRIKIGYARDIPKRMRELQCGNSQPLTLLGAIEAHSKDDERKIHQRFAEHRIFGEWFTENHELLAFIEKMRLPTMVEALRAIPR